MGNIEAGNQGVAPDLEEKERRISGVVREAKAIENGRLLVVFRNSNNPIIIEVGSDIATQNGEASGQD